MSVLVGLLGGALAGWGIGLLVAGWASSGSRSAGRGLGGSAARFPGHPDAWWLRAARTLAPFVRRWTPTPTDASRRIEAAGLSLALRPSDLRAVRGAGAVVGLGLGVVLVPIAGTRAVALALVMIPLALGLLPDLVLRRRAARRAATMLRSLPDTIDLLRIAMRSGRSVPETVARVGAHQHGALGEELRRAAAEIRLGVAVESALTGMRRRCPAEGIPELVALLLRAHRHGRTVADGLEALADDLRDRRAREAIDRAARAAPKIQLVVALLLVPAAMLLIAAALLQLRTG